VQSSSATALIASSFVSQNLIGLSAALVIMLGADVGTALMTQVFSLDLAWLSPLLITFGVLFFLSKRNTRAGRWAGWRSGWASSSWRSSWWCRRPGRSPRGAGAKVIFGTLTGDPMLDMLIGALFTVLSFSSLAVVLLAATLAASNVIGVPVALGSCSGRIWAAG
jgi:phosphate:Na+ symporter